MAKFDNNRHADGTVQARLPSHMSQPGQYTHTYRRGIWTLQPMSSLCSATNNKPHDDVTVQKIYALFPMFMAHTMN